MEAIQITCTGIADVPDGPCDKCGADVSHYEPHPVLIGGNCTNCGGCWLPPMTWGEPEVIAPPTAHINDDGSVTLTLQEG